MQRLLEMECGLQPALGGGKPMYLVKQLLGTYVILRDYDVLVRETMVMICMLNKMTRAGMSENVQIA